MSRKSESTALAPVSTETDIALRVIDVKAYLAWVSEPIGTPLPEISLEDAAVWGTELYARRVKVDWKLLDWVAWLIEKYPDTWESVIPLTGIQPGTLRDYMNVATGTNGVRDERLSVSFHRVISSHGTLLKEQETRNLLARAHDERMTLKTFKHMVQATTGKRHQMVRQAAKIEPAPQEASDQTLELEFEEGEPFSMTSDEILVDVSTITKEDFPDSKPALVNAVTLDGAYPGFEAMFMRGNAYHTIRAMAAYIAQLTIEGAVELDVAIDSEENPFVPAAGEIWRTKTEPMATWKVLKVEGDSIYARNTATSTRLRYEMGDWLEAFTPVYQS